LTVTGDAVATDDLLRPADDPAVRASDRAPKSGTHKRVLEHRSVVSAARMSSKAASALPSASSLGARRGPAAADVVTEHHAVA
jgi:hypothetical protein